VNMTDLEQRLDALGDHLDTEREQRTISANGRAAMLVDLDPQAVDSASERRPKRPVGSVVLRVAAALVLLGGVVAGIAKFSQDTEQRDVVSTTPVALQLGQGVGLFPVGTRVGLETPEAAASAYLADRIASAPAGLELTADIGIASLIGESRAMVVFTLRSPDDASDGLVLLGRTGQDPDAWVALSAATIGFDVEDITFADSLLTATISSPTGAVPQVALFDAATGAMPVPGTNPAGGLNDRASGVELEVSGVAAETVGVRLWDIGRPESQAGPRVNFAEFIVADGDLTVQAGWEVLTSFAATAGGPDAGSSVADASGTIDQGDCSIRVRIYNAGPAAGSASRATVAIREAINLDNTMSGGPLEPTNAAAWDGGVAWIVGPDATCFDLDSLGLPVADQVLRGDPSQQLANLGLDERDQWFQDAGTSNTVVVLLGQRYLDTD